MKKKGERTVQITVSVPLSIASSVDEEALLMGKSYSDATVYLLRLGLNIRGTTRQSVEGVKREAERTGSGP